MKATGELIFTQQSNGSVTHEWKGGRVAIVSGDLLNAMHTVKRQWWNEALEHGLAVSIGGVNLRVVDTASYLVGGPAYAVMREGWLARLVAWYVRTVYTKLFPRLDKIDLFWQYGTFDFRSPKAPLFFDYKKWSLCGIVSYPIWRK